MGADQNRILVGFKETNKSINFAVACGAKFSIDPDSHRIAGFNDIKYGVAVARKAGLRAEQVVTCLEADEFLSQLR